MLPSDLVKYKEKSEKIAAVYIRSTPVMEILTGIMIAILIFYSGKLISKGELEINNFFSFLAAMMLAYQPVRALSTLTMNINQGLSAASRILPIIDQKNLIKDSEHAVPIVLKNSDIEFKNINSETISLESALKKEKVISLIKELQNNHPKKGITWLRREASKVLTAEGLKGFSYRQIMRDTKGLKLD